MKNSAWIYVFSSQGLNCSLPQTFSSCLFFGATVSVWLSFVFSGMYQAAPMQQREDPANRTASMREVKEERGHNPKELQPEDAPLLSPGSLAVGEA